MTPIENQQLKGITVKILCAILFSTVSITGSAVALYFQNDKRITLLENKAQNDVEFKRDISEQMNNLKSDVSDIKSRLIIIENSRK